MNEMMERLESAVAALEAAAARLGEREESISAAAEERVERIVATVEGHRETELAEQLRRTQAQLMQAELKVTELSAAAGQTSAGSGRKTAAVGVVATLAKQGISAGALEGLESGRFEAGALDTALASLSIEQRFAVKAEMLRAGLLG